MGYLGLVPSEHSCGGSIRRGGITKTGNREARRMLIEAARSYQYPARVAEEKAEILVKLPKNIRDIAWKAQTRLCTRYRSNGRPRQEAHRRRHRDRARAHQPYVSNRPGDEDHHGSWIGHTSISPLVRGPDNRSWRSSRVP